MFGRGSSTVGSGSRSTSVVFLKPALPKQLMTVDVVTAAQADLSMCTASSSVTALASVVAESSLPASRVNFTYDSANHILPVVVFDAANNPHVTWLYQ